MSAPQHFDVQRFIGLGLVIVFSLLSLLSFNRSRPVFKIAVTESGVYRVSYEDLAAAGLPPGSLSSAGLALRNRGIPVPVWIEDGQDGVIGQFGPGDWIEFVGSHLPGDTAYYNEFSAQNIYALETSGDQPVRMQSGRPEQPLSVLPFRIQRHLESDTLLMRFRPQGDVLQAETLQDLWYWAKLTHIDPTPFQVSLDVDGRTLDQTSPVSLQLKFRGWSQRYRKAAAADHRVEVSLNGKLIGGGEWNGQDEYLLTVTVPAEQFLPESNTLSIRVPSRPSAPQPPGRTETSTDRTDPIVDVSLLNWIEISTAHRTAFTADQTRLSFVSAPQAAEEQKKTTYGRPTAQQLVLYGENGSRIVMPDQAQSLPSDSVPLPVDNQVFHAVRNGQLRSPQAIVLDQPSSLTDRTNQADYLMIAHPRLIEAIQPLAAFHRRRGLSVAVVDVNDIYDEFNHGILHPGAIRAFIAYAHNQWAAPAPRFVLLVGDASWDSKNTTAQDENYPDWTYQPYHQTEFIKNGSTPYPDLTNQTDAPQSNQHTLRNQRNLIPTWNYNSYEGHAASDNWFVALDEADFHPRLAIGRFPVTEPEEVSAIVDKTIRYAEQPEIGPWQRHTLWITNEHKGFQLQTDQLASHTQQAGFQTFKIYPQPHETDNILHQTRLRQALDDGQLLVHFIGHGGRYIWRTGPPDLRKNHDLFTLEDLDQLAPTNRLPVVLSMTCYSAPFDHPSADSIGEKFLRLPDRGAVAVFAASWRNSPHSAFSEAIVRELLKPGTIGEAILRGKQSIADRLLIETYNLLGDPALPLALPHVGSPLEVANNYPPGWN